MNTTRPIVAALCICVFAFSGLLPANPTETLDERQKLVLEAKMEAESKKEKKFQRRLQNLGLGEVELTGAQQAGIRRLMRNTDRQKLPIGRARAEAVRTGADTSAQDQQKKAMDERFRQRLDAMLTPVQRQLRAEALARLGTAKVDKIIDPAAPWNPVGTTDGVEYARGKSSTQIKKENAFAHYYATRINGHVRLLPGQEEEVKKILFEGWSQRNLAKLDALGKGKKADEGHQRIEYETDLRMAAVLGAEQFDEYKINWICSKLAGKAELSASQNASLRQEAQMLWGKIKLLPRELEIDRNTKEGKKTMLALKQHWEASTKVAGAITGLGVKQQIEAKGGKPANQLTDEGKRADLIKQLSRGLALDSEQQVLARKVAADASKAGMTMKNGRIQISPETEAAFKGILTPEQRLQYETAKAQADKKEKQKKQTQNEMADLGLATLDLAANQRQEVAEALRNARQQRLANEKERREGGAEQAYNRRKKEIQSALIQRLETILTPGQRQQRVEALAKRTEINVSHSIGLTKPPSGDGDARKPKTSTQAKKEKEFENFYKARINASVGLDGGQEAPVRRILFDGWTRQNVAKLDAFEHSASGKPGIGSKEQVLRIQEETDRQLAKEMSPGQFDEYKINWVYSRLVEKASLTKGQSEAVRRTAGQMWNALKKLPPESDINEKTEAGRSLAESYRTIWVEGRTNTATILGTKPPSEGSTPVGATWENKRRLHIAQTLGEGLDLDAEQQALVRKIAADVAKQERQSAQKGMDVLAPMSSEAMARLMGILTSGQKVRYEALQEARKQ